LDFGATAGTEGTVEATGEPANPRAQAAAERLIRIAREALPPQLTHLAAMEWPRRSPSVGFRQSSVSLRTEKIYADTWAAFCDWCDAHHAPVLPAAPAIVAAYLAARQDSLGCSGLRLAGHASSSPGLLSIIAERTCPRPLKEPPRKIGLVVRSLSPRCTRDFRHGPMGPNRRYKEMRFFRMTPTEVARVSQPVHRPENTIGDQRCQRPKCRLSNNAFR
jgi:hypothetical protein